MQKQDVETQYIIEDSQSLEDGKRVDTMTINMGPQHPSTHGVLRLILTINGETVVKAVPDIGFLHTGIEKTAEAKTYQQALVLTDRMDYLSPLCSNLGYSLAVEKLLGIEDEITDKIKYVRVLLAELQRIASHLIWLERTKGVGTLSAQDAIAYGASGPVLRGSNVVWDIRKAFPYSGYENFDSDIPVGTNGD